MQQISSSFQPRTLTAFEWQASRAAKKSGGKNSFFMFMSIILMFGIIEAYLSSIEIEEIYYSRIAI